MNTILLQPTDVLFFRDGRPMSGSLAGHGAAWPLPHVINAAFHAALHRAFGDQPSIGARHAPARRENGQRTYAPNGERDRRFVDVWSLGPFPVNPEGRCFFPRPADTQETSTVAVTLRPTRAHGADAAWMRSSSLPAPLRYAVANTRPPEKEAGGEPWLSQEAFAAYLGQKNSPTEKPERHFLRDEAIFDREQTIGIAIDPETQTAGQGDATGKIYSAHYLRLREGFRLGTAAGDGRNGESCVFDQLFETEKRIVVGGQQRLCTVESHRGENLPLPRSSSFTKSASGKYLIKWVLLTPAIWPEIPAERDGKPIRDRDGKPIILHRGGWLPNWVDLQGKVRLKAVEQRRPTGMHRKIWRDALQQNPEIQASLVAAIVPKPIAVTGWALNLQAGADNPGAKSTHLAVPAGAVYYFESEPNRELGTTAEQEAAKLTAALNWHGNDSNPTTIRNRRSTLMGEKGFGLGVCGTWNFYQE